MKKDNLEFIFNSFNNKRILIIGDVMVDSYLWGKVNRISPEAPVPIVSITKRENRPGGAANVAVNIKSLGAEPLICSVIGDDESGKEFFELMKNGGMSPVGLVVNNSRTTTKKSRIISSNQHLLRVDEEISSQLDEASRTDFIEKTSKIISLENIDAVVFQDYDKGVISKEVIENITELCIKKNIPTLVDPKKRNFRDYRNVTFFKPNFNELTEGLKTDLEKRNTEDIYNEARKLHDNGIEYVMVTLSEHGVLISHNNNYHKIPAEVRDIADVSGAGDTVISVACMCLLAGCDAKDIAAISNLAGGLVCENAGVVPVNKALLLKECTAYYSDNQ